MTDETKRTQAQLDRVAAIKRHLRHQHQWGRSPEAVSKIEKQALEEMADRPKLELHYTPNWEDVKDLKDDMDRYRNARIGHIEQRLADTKYEKETAGRFNDAASYDGHGNGAVGRYKQRIEGIKDMLRSKKTGLELTSRFNEAARDWGDGHDR